MQTHIPKICSDFLQNHIDKRMFEIYNKFTVKEQMFANICFKSMGGIYYDERIQRKDNCYTKHSQKFTPRKMSYQKNKMQTSPFGQYVFDLSGNSFHTPFYQRRCKCRYIDQDYRDLKKILGMDPLQVTIFTCGTFEAYEKKTGKKIHQMNPSHYDMKELLDVQEYLNKVR